MPPFADRPSSRIHPRSAPASYGQRRTSRKVNTPRSQSSLLLPNFATFPIHQSLSGCGVECSHADSSGQAYFLAVGELSDVLRAKGVQPAELASFVADDDAGQDGAGGGEGALRCRSGRRRCR